MQDKVQERKGKEKEKKQVPILKQPHEYTQCVSEESILAPEGDLQKGSLVLTEGQSYVHHLSSQRSAYMFL